MSQPLLPFQLKSFLSGFLFLCVDPLGLDSEVALHSGLLLLLYRLNTLEQVSLTVVVCSADTT